MNRMTRSNALPKSDIVNSGLRPDVQRAFYKLARKKVCPFIQRIFDSAETVSRDAHSVPRIGLSSRQMRAKSANLDPNADTKPATTEVNFTVTPVSLAHDMDRRIDDNTIEGNAFESTVIDLLSRQWGLDLQDLVINGDASLDDEFLGINDGLVELVSTNGVTIDGSVAALNSGGIHEGHFSAALKNLNGRFIQESNSTGETDHTVTNYVFCMSHLQKMQWLDYAAARQDTLGASAFSARVGGGSVMRPFGIGIEVVPDFPDGKLLLTSPDFLRMVRTEDMVLLSTDQGRENIRARTRSFAMHGDFDLVLMEDEAHVIVTGLLTT